MAGAAPVRPDFWSRLTLTFIVQIVYRNGINIAMKIYEVTVEDRVHTVGKIEMEYLVMVFGDKAQVSEIQLTDNTSSVNLSGDERSN